MEAEKPTQKARLAAKLRGSGRTARWLQSIREPMAWQVSAESHEGSSHHIPLEMPGLRGSGRKGRQHGR